MADLVFRSTTRGGRDFFEVTDDGMIYGGKDRYNIKTDESMSFADTVEQVLAELVFDGAWRINYDKIEVDELGIGKEYKEIVKLIRQKYNWLYNLPKGSKGRQFYFDIGRYFKQMIAKGVDYDKIFDKIDDVIEKNNFEESKENRIMKKSIKEKLNDNGEVQYDDIYSCELKNVLEVTIYDKELYEELREQDLVIYGKGTYENIDWKMFQDEIGYLRDDINASDDFDMKLFLANGTLLIDIMDIKDNDLIMELRLESKFVQ